MEPNISEAGVTEETRERGRRESVAVGKAKEVVVDQRGTRHRREWTTKRAPKARVRFTIGDADRECPASGHQAPCGHGSGARIGKLLERIPDRDRVESTTVDGIQLTNGNAKSHSTGEGGGARIDVESFERPASVTRGGQECADVAPDLEPGSPSTMSALEATHLRAIRTPLGLVQCP